MKKTITSGFEKNPENGEDNIYYNLTLVNSTDNPLNVQFNQTLGNSIVDSPQDYYLSCIRFFLDTANLPIFIFEENTYSVSISCNGVTHTEIVPFISASGQPETYFNGIYSYQNFIDMINVALSTAYTDFGGTLPAAATVAPYLYFDPRANGLISLFAQTAYDSTNSNPATLITIWMNEDLYYFFDNFLYFFNKSNIALPFGYQIIIKSMGHGQNTSAFDSTVPSGYYKMSQEYVAANRWRGPASLSFTSYTIGCRTEYITGISNNANSNIVQNAGTGIPLASQFTDFIVSTDPGDLAGWRGNLIYNSSSQYRLVDLQSSIVNKIDLSLYWQDVNNNSYPFSILPGTQSSIKLLFVKRSLYKNYIKT